MSEININECRNKGMVFSDLGTKMVCMIFPSAKRALNMLIDQECTEGETDIKYLNGKNYQTTLKWIKLLVIVMITAVFTSCKEKQEQHHPDRAENRIDNVDKTSPPPLADSVQLKENLKADSIGK